MIQLELLQHFTSTEPNTGGIIEIAQSTCMSVAIYCVQACESRRRVFFLDLTIRDLLSSLEKREM